MSSWGNYDNAANAPYWAVNSTIVHTPTAANVARPTAANVAVLFGNTTPNVYIQNTTIGLFGVDAQEVGATMSTDHPCHQGWVLKTTGQGGRAGRVTHEVLVALSNMYGDSDAQVYPNVSITLVGPDNQSVVSNGTYSNVAIFTVTPSLAGNTSASLSYLWQYNNTSGSTGWTNIPANTVPVQWSGATSSILYVRPKTTANDQTVLRVTVTAADQGVTKVSANAILSVPA